MRKLFMPLLAVEMLLFFSVSLIAQTIPTDSLYLGQTPPGSTPKVFNLPVTSGFHACERIAISSDGKEIYYGELNTYPASQLRVKCFKYLDNKWQGPTVAFESFMAPSLSPDDSIIYLQDNTFHTFYSKRIAGGWSVPVRLLSPNMRTHYFRMTDLHNTFASSYYEGEPTDGNICQVIVSNGDTVLQSLGIPINTSSKENDFFIAPDESYILFSRNASGAGSDMYLSFKKDSGKWTSPKVLAEPINKPGYNWEYGQFISEDGKYLFFTSGGANMNQYYTYWIRIDNIIDSLRHTNFAPYLNKQIPNQSGITGQSFTYTVSDSVFIDDDGNNTLTYSATLSNSNPLPSWLSFDTLTRTFTGVPGAAGNLAVRVRVTDNAGATVSCTFTINVSVTGTEDETGEVPGEMNLYQNYPNPFNPTTTIEFTVSKAGRYKLDLLNSLGESVQNISDREYYPGHHTESLDASGLASGVYFYILTGSNIRLINKMLLIR